MFCCSLRLRELCSTVHLHIFKKTQTYLSSKVNRMRDQSLFIEFMGDSPTIRVLDYLLTERDLDFSITDMAKNAGIGRSTLYRIWEGLIKNKIIVPTRIIGKAKLFKLNKDNLAIQKLIEIDDALITQELKQQVKEVKVPV